MMRDDDREGVRCSVSATGVEAAAADERALLTHVEADLDQRKIELSLERNVFWRGAWRAGMHAGGVKSRAVTNKAAARRAMASTELRKLLYSVAGRDVKLVWEGDG